MEKSKEDSTTEEEFIIKKTKVNDEINKFDVYGSVFTLPVRYEVTKPLGSGAYGWVVQWQDLK